MGVVLIDRCPVDGCRRYVHREKKSAPLNYCPVHPKKEMTNSGMWWVTLWNTSTPVPYADKKPWSYNKRDAEAEDRRIKEANRQGTPIYHHAKKLRQFTYSDALEHVKTTKKWHEGGAKHQASRLRINEDLIKRLKNASVKHLNEHPSLVEQAIMEKLFEVRDKELKSDYDKEGKLLPESKRKKRKPHAGQSTFNSYVREVKSVFNDLIKARLGIITENGLNDIGQFTNVIREATVTEAQMTHILKDCRKASRNLSTAVMVGFCSGLRRANLLSLRWDKNILWKENLIHVPRAQVKKKREPVNVAIIEQLAGLLHEHYAWTQKEFGSENVWVFPSKTSRTGHYVEPSKAFNKILVKHGLRGIEGEDDFTLHSLRDSFATVFLRNNPKDMENLRAILGHADISTTSRNYTHMDNADKARAMKKFGSAVSVEAPIGVN